LETDAMRCPGFRSTSLAAVSAVALALVSINHPVVSAAVDQSFEPYRFLTCEANRVYAWHGFIWLGTNQGLYRCLPNGSELSKINTSQIFCFCQENKDLLVGASGNLFRLTPPGNTAVPDGIWGGEMPYNVKCLSVTHDALWIGTDGDGLFRRQGQGEPRSVIFPKSSEALLELGASVVGSIASLQGGGPLVAASTVTPGRFTRSVNVNCLLNVGTHLWVGTDWGLYRVDVDQLVADAPKVSVSVFALHEYGGSLWYATVKTVVQPDDPGQVRRILPDEQVDEVVPGPETGHVWRFEEAGGALWVAGERGLFRCRAGVKPLLEKSKLIPEGVKDITEVTDLCHSEDAFWVASKSGLYRLEGANGGGWNPNIHITWRWYIPYFTGGTLVLPVNLNNYGRRTNPDLVQLHVLKDDGLVQPDPKVVPAKDGFQVNIDAVSFGLHRFAIQAEDLYGLNGNLSEQVYVIAVPFWPSVVVLVMFSGAATIAAWTALVKMFRGVLVTIGLAEWQFEPDKQALTQNLTVLNDGPIGPWEVVDQGGRPHTFDPLPPGKQIFPDLFGIRRSGDTVLIWVGEKAFLCPWAKSFSDGLFGREKRTVAGQLALNKLGHPGPPAAPVTFAGIACLAPGGGEGCENQKQNPLRGLDELRAKKISSGFRRILEWKQRWRFGRRLVRYFKGAGWQPHTLCDLFEERFHLWGAAIFRFPSPAQARTAATTYDFFDALRGADIVHVHAHGSAGGAGLCLSDGPVTATDLNLVLPFLRCRLLVLSACEVGTLSAGVASFVYPLVQRGVRVVAATEEVDQRANITFFLSFYASLFPRWLSHGRTIGTALRDAGKACDAGAGSDEFSKQDWKPGIDSIVLYGDPTTNLRFKLTFHRWLEALKQACIWVRLTCHNWLGALERAGIWLLGRWRAEK
jgi:hypothetical protein